MAVKPQSGDEPFELGSSDPMVAGVYHEDLERVRLEFPLSAVEPVYRAYLEDHVDGRLYWPWIALTASEYRSERKYRSTRRDEPKPSEVLALLGDVEATSQRLMELILRVEELAFRLEEAEHPARRSHLRWVYDLLLKYLQRAREITRDDWESRAKPLAFKETFVLELVALQMAAAEARRSVDLKSLKRPKPQRDPALYNLIWRAAAVWESMTGRRASVNKVHRRGHDTRSDFMIFVAGVAKLASDREPTATEILTAFRTWNSARKKSL